MLVNIDEYTLHVVCGTSVVVFYIVLLIVSARLGKKKTLKGDTAPVTAESPKPAKHPPVVATPVQEGLFERLRSGLEKTRVSFSDKLDLYLAKHKSIDDALLEDIFSALISADVGVGTSEKLIAQVKVKLEKEQLKDPQAVKGMLKILIGEILSKPITDIKVGDTKPWVIMVIGVNGVGKTTSIGKLANRFKQEGHNVMLAAADTFRAAAIDQLGVWADRLEIDMVKHKLGSDPSAVVFDALKSAKAKKKDIVIVDTAGRLHTKVNLMEELAKIKRIIAREVEGAPHEVYLVLDATTGQNAVQQVRTFNDAIDATGIILTKLDGTAKGGVCIGVMDEIPVPIRYIGIGEQIDDLRVFNGREFAEALF